MESDLDLSPMQQAIRELSKKSELTHRNHDCTDPPYFKEGDPVFNEPLLPTTICNICQSIHFLPSFELSSDEVRAARLCFPDEKEWVFSRRLFYFHQPSLEALYESMCKGCHSCILIWNNAFAGQDLSTSDLRALNPVILDHSLAMGENVWDPDWFPGNGSYMGICHASKQYGWGQLRFIHVPSQYSKFSWNLILTSARCHDTHTARQCLHSGFYASKCASRKEVARHMLDQSPQMLSSRYSTDAYSPH